MPQIISIDNLVSLFMQSIEKYTHDKIIKDRRGPKFTSSKTFTKHLLGYEYFTGDERLSFVFFLINVISTFTENDSINITVKISQQEVRW